MGYDLGHTWLASCFPYFLQFKSEFCNKVFMTWAQSAPSLIFADCIELLHLQLQRIQSVLFWYWLSDFDVGHLVISMWSHLLCCWKRVLAMTRAFSWQNSVSLCPAAFCTPRPNFLVTLGISWLPTFAFQPLWWKGQFSPLRCSRRGCRSSQTCSTSVSLALVVAA